MISTPRALRFLVAASVCGASPLLATAGPSVTIDLAGVRISNGRTESRSSTTTLDPAGRYSYAVTGQVRGTPTFSGLWFLFPNPVPLAQAFEALAPGTSEVLSGTVCNPQGALPVQVLNVPFATQAPVGSLTVTFEATLSVGIDAAGIASFSMANIVLTPTSVGGVLFDSGSVVITALPSCPGDFDCSGLVDDSDFVIFAVQYEQFVCSAPGPVACPADLSGDGFIDDTDFVTFAAAYEAFTCP